MEKYTVIIPTRDRAETLAATIRTCLRQTYENFEVIVSDNCSLDNTKEVVDGFCDSRIRYVNPGRRLSMSGNFEFALRHVEDGFVMFIGSDDGVMPDAIEYVDSIVKKYKVDAVSCFQSFYYWPNFPDESISGSLTFGSQGRNIEIRKSKEWIEKAISFKSTRYCHDLPNLYCGFVHKRVINKALKDGLYFRSITPDAYSAFATALFVDEYAFSMRPFSIAGQSGKSNGVSALFASGDQKESEKFYSENDIEFCTGFANCPSFQVILAEAFAQAASAFPEQSACYHIDYKAMLVTSLRDVNEKTKMKVIEAVEIMIDNFSVDVENYSTKSFFDIFRFKQRLSSLGRVIDNPLEIIGVQKSHLFGVMDVNDAALVAHLFMHCNESDAFISRRSSMLRSIYKLFGY